jgi:hypothetical protein
VELVIGGEQERQVQRPQRLDRADQDATGADPGERLKLRLAGLDLGKRPPRPLGEARAGFGQRHPAGGALHQCESDLALEAADLLREGGLRDVLARGGAGEVALVRERDQVAELAQFHIGSL